MGTWTIRYTWPSGHPYHYWEEDVGSVIPKRYLRTVFYVFPDKKSADESAPTGASGFFVRHRRFVAGKWMFYLYAVTNDHALKDKAGRLFPNPAIRFNIEGKAESVDTNRLRWIRDENRDIAVTPLFNKEEYAHAHFLETHEFVEKNKIGNDLWRWEAGGVTD
jgi:hypothetical protein